MTLYVTKADGTKQPFDRAKVIGTCLRMGASVDLAETIAKSVESHIYGGVGTDEILRMIFTLLRKQKPTVKYHIDLRRALGLLRSKPDFEVFVQVLLSEEGYEVTPNRIVRGRCVEHEVDAIARKNGQAYIVEVKQHSDYHRPTGLDVARIARAVLEDLTEGYEAGLSDLKVDSAMIVCNTRFSEHAKQYAKCRGILHIGWSSPPEYDLQTMIREKKAYPITYLRDLKSSTRDGLASRGIVILKQLIHQQSGALSREIGVGKSEIEMLIERATAILDARWEGHQMPANDNVKQ